MEEMSVYSDAEQLPIGRTYCKQYFSISAAVHNKVGKFFFTAAYFFLISKICMVLL